MFLSRLTFLRDPYCPWLCSRAFSDIYSDQRSSAVVVMLSCTWSKVVRENLDGIHRDLCSMIGAWQEKSRRLLQQRRRQWDVAFEVCNNELASPSFSVFPGQAQWWIDRKGKAKILNKAIAFLQCVRRSLRCVWKTLCSQ